MICSFPSGFSFFLSSPFPVWHFLAIWYTEYSIQYTEGRIMMNHFFMLTVLYLLFYRSSAMYWSSAFFGPFSVFRWWPSVRLAPHFITQFIISVKSDGYILPTFWKSFCSSLKQGILLTLLCLFISVFCVLSYFFITAEGQSQILLFSTLRFSFWQLSFFYTSSYVQLSDPITVLYAIFRNF